MKKINVLAISVFVMLVLGIFVSSLEELERVKVDGTLTKMVDGKRISLDYDEELSIREEWAENERLKAIEYAKQIPLTLEEKFVLLEIRITELENLLNITYVEPEENSLPLYYCAIERSTKECPGGISGGFNTRCYLKEPKQSPWDYCLDGWELA